MIGVVRFANLFSCDYIVPDLFLSFFPPPPPPQCIFGWMGWGEGVGDGGIFRKLGHYVFCCILLLD